ncbi:Topoisomerase I damage affected 6 [Hyphodiscus hymeniophilus]|uniref:Topoisomerase I damage affected 6 n=1 Tax=Hyphodiscus hymeniophilus TaxID=353542 RepID=A0A9P6VET5_9HELO|nr:Topoisomerase I damage affected 6 [Hyphodiscus hymeniophilus]
MNDSIKPVSIPRESIALSDDLVRVLANTSIPEYVIKYAPLVFLDKSDQFNPSDLSAHVANTHPTVDFSPVDITPLGLDGLDKLNDLGGEEVYLTSTESLDTIPGYLHGQAPNKKTLQTENAVSAVIIVVEKGDGVVDAFYMYFYTFNQGPSAIGKDNIAFVGTPADRIREHNMIRFRDGMPTVVWYSQHEYGQAFLYYAPEKIGGRPIAYSAKGSHANYAFAGKHDLHDDNDQIPENIAFDHTSRGLLWDPTLSAYYYTYSLETKRFSPVPEETPVDYLYFNGRWGDQEFADDMPGQSSFHGFHKFTGGPQGPWFKHLDREDVCLPHGVPCEVKASL